MTTELQVCQAELSRTREQAEQHLVECEKWKLQQVHRTEEIQHSADEARQQHASVCRQLSQLEAAHEKQQEELAQVRIKS